MKSTIYIPKKINVGYQERKDTYTGKLAYVIYWDEKGVLRKEKSWNGWRDEGIPNDEFENIPTEGFVLNKHAGGVENSWGWNARKSYCRIYDPRGFEFEITIENLLYILENTSCIKGKGIEGELIYGWNGSNLVLIPVESPDYKKMVTYSNAIKENKMFSAKNVIVGGTYLTKDNERWIYMGRFDTYSDWCYGRDDIDKVFDTYKQLKKYCDKNNIKKNGLYYGYSYHYTIGMIGKHYWFYNGTRFLHQKSFPKNKIIDCIDDKCSDEYADLFYKMEGDENYSPYDKTKNKIVPYTIDEFRKNFNCFGRRRFISNYRGKYNSYEIRKYNSGYMMEEKTDGRYRFCDIFPYKTYGLRGETKKMIPVSLEEIFEKMKPEYIQTYLQNGREYEKRGELKNE